MVAARRVQIKLSLKYISDFIAWRNLAKAGFSYISTRRLKPVGNEIEYHFI
jgi:hypothetical protein